MVHPRYELYTNLYISSWWDIPEKLNEKNKLCINCPYFFKDKKQRQKPFYVQVGM